MQTPSVLDSTGKAGSQAELPFFVAELPEGKRLGNLIAVCTQIGAWQGVFVVNEAPLKLMLWL